MTKKQLTAEERKLLNKLQYKARGTARNTAYKRKARQKLKEAGTPPAPAEPKQSQQNERP